MPRRRPDKRIGRCRINSQSSVGLARFGFFSAGFTGVGFFGPSLRAAFFIARSTACSTPVSVAPLCTAFLTAFSSALRAFSVFFFAIVGLLDRRNATVIQYGTGCAVPDF